MKSLRMGPGAARLLAGAAALLVSASAARASAADGAPAAATPTPASAISAPAAAAPGPVPAASAAPPATSAPPPRTEAASAQATPPTSKREDDWENAVPTRRSGFSAGLSFGLGAGRVAGFPNDVKKINYRRYYTETPISAGSAFEIWIAGALTDWLNFGFGLGGQSLKPTDEAGAAASFTFRVEAFPLFYEGGRYRDLGVQLLAGTGGATLKKQGGAEDVLVDGGAVSRIAAGAFYEGVRVWKFGMGPFAVFDYSWSESVRQSAVFVGWRSAIYTGRIGPERR